MNDDLKQLITSFGYDVEAMQKDNVPMQDYKDLLKSKGYNIDAMDKDGLFGTVEVSPQESLIDTSIPEDAMQVQTEVPGTVQPTDDTATMTMPEIQASESADAIQDVADFGEQTIAGMRQSVTLPLAKVLEDSFKKVGLDLGNQSSQDLSKITKLINDYNEKHPDQLVHPATVGNIVSQMAVPTMKSIKSVAIVESVLNTLHGIGQRGDYDHVGRDATIGAVFGASTMFLFNQVAKRVGPLSYGAKLLIKKHPELTDEVASEILKGVPKHDQTRALVDFMEDGDLSGFTKAAVEGSNVDKLLLKSQMKRKTKDVQAIIGDVEKQIDEAKVAYGDMADELALHNKNTFDFSSMMPNLENLIQRYDNTQSKAMGILNSMKADIDLGKGFMNVRTALEFRQDLNYLVNKAKRHREKELLKGLQSGVDKFLKNNLDDATMGQVDDAISNYARAMNNRDFIDVMDKYIKKNITDWVGLNKALKKEKLTSPEVDLAINVITELSKKFKADKELRGAVKVRGQSDTALSALGVRSWFIQKILDPLDTIFVQSTRHKELIIQDEILKSIRKAKTSKSVVDEILTNSKIPEDVAKVVVKDINELLRIEYHPDRPTSVTTPEGEVRTLYTTPQGTTSETPLGGMAYERFTGQHDPIGLPAPRAPIEAPTTKLESGETKFVNKDGRVSTNIDKANPPEFVSKTSSIDVNNVLETVTAGQRRLGYTLRLSLADTKTAKYGRGIDDNQLIMDRDRSINAINLIVEKSQSGERLSRRDRETLLQSLARTRQIDRELDIRGYEGNYQIDVPREDDSILNRPGNYRPRRSRTDVQPVVTQTPQANRAQPAVTQTQRPIVVRSVYDKRALEVADIINEGEVFASVRGRTVSISATSNGPRMHFTLLDNNVFKAESTAFRRGSGVGGRVYKAFWDSIRGTRFKAQPTGSMYTVNQFRMSVNMLEYAARHGDSPHVLIYAGANNAQKGASSALHNQPLTVKNANLLAQGLRRWMNTNILSKFDKKLHKNTTDAQITEMVEQARREPSLKRFSNARREPSLRLNDDMEPSYPFGVKTLKLLRRVAQTGSLTALSGVFGMLMLQDDFVKYLNTLDKGDETN